MRKKSFDLRTANWLPPNIMPVKGDDNHGTSVSVMDQRLWFIRIHSHGLWVGGGWEGGGEMSESKRCAEGRRRMNGRLKWAIHWRTRSVNNGIVKKLLYLNSLYLVFSSYSDRLRLRGSMVFAEEHLAGETSEVTWRIIRSPLLIMTEFLIKFRTGTRGVLL